MSSRSGGPPPFRCGFSHPDLRPGRCGTRRARTGRPSSIPERRCCWNAKLPEDRIATLVARVATTVAATAHPRGCRRDTTEVVATRLCSGDRSARLERPAEHRRTAHPCRKAGARRPSRSTAARLTHAAHQCGTPPHGAPVQNTAARRTSRTPPHGAPGRTPPHGAPQRAWAAVTANSSAPQMRRNIRARLTSWMALVTWMPRGQASVQLKVVRQRQTPSASLRISSRSCAALVAGVEDEPVRVDDRGRADVGVRRTSTPGTTWCTRRTGCTWWCRRTGRRSAGTARTPGSARGRR